MKRGNLEAMGLLSMVVASTGVTAMAAWMLRRRAKPKDMLLQGEDSASKVSFELAYKKVQLVSRRGPQQHTVFTVRLLASWVQKR